MNYMYIFDCCTPQSSVLNYMAYNPFFGNERFGIHECILVSV